MPSYLERLYAVLAQVDLTTIDAMVAAIKVADHVYVCGNGGSAANAAHLQLHLEEQGCFAINLLADQPRVSALSNDRAYDDVLRQRLRHRGSTDDCLVVLSGSGESRNIILALVEARRIDMVTLGLLGQPAATAVALCDHALTFQTQEYGPLEDAHSAIIHIIYERLAGPVAASSPVRPAR